MKESLPQHHEIHALDAPLHLRRVVINPLEDNCTVYHAHRDLYRLNLENCCLSSSDCSTLLKYARLSIDFCAVDHTSHLRQADSSSSEDEFEGYSTVPRLHWIDVG